MSSAFKTAGAHHALKPGTLSISRLARLGGAFYLAIIGGGACGEVMLRDRVIVGGDAAATAANLLAVEPL